MFSGWDKGVALEAEGDMLSPRKASCMEGGASEGLVEAGYVSKVKIRILKIRTPVQIPWNRDACQMWTLTASSSKRAFTDASCTACQIRKMDPTQKPPWIQPRTPHAVYRLSKRKPVPDLAPGEEL